jgi:metallophosphoesterase (TIGR00282 family)
MDPSGHSVAERFRHPRDEPVVKVGIVLIGDIVGDAGMRAVFANVRGLQRRTGAAVMVANGENAVDGYGLTPEVVDRIFGFGVQVITSGNHVWQHSVLHFTLDREQRLLRPENYLSDAPGHGWCVVSVPGVDVAVLNLQGRHALPSPRCPFQAADSAVAALRPRAAVIVVDLHAESSEEKEALALHLDGRVSAVIGTHTHVTTADERILPGGTAYITDVGMTGPVGGVIGFDERTSVRRSLSQMPLKLAVADGPSVLNAVHVEVDAESGRALSIERLRISQG